MSKCGTRSQQRRWGISTRDVQMERDGKSQPWYRRENAKNTKNTLHTSSHREMWLEPPHPSPLIRLWRARALHCEQPGVVGRGKKWDLSMCSSPTSTAPDGSKGPGLTHNVDKGHQDGWESLTAPCAGGNEGPSSHKGKKSKKRNRNCWCQQGRVINKCQQPKLHPKGHWCKSEKKLLELSYEQGSPRGSGKNPPWSSCPEQRDFVIKQVKLVQWRSWKCLTSIYLWEGNRKLGFVLSWLSWHFLTARKKTLKSYWLHNQQHWVSTAQGVLQSTKSQNNPRSGWAPAQVPHVRQENPHCK